MANVQTPHFDGHVGACTRRSARPEIPLMVYVQWCIYPGGLQRRQHHSRTILMIHILCCSLRLCSTGGKLFLSPDLSVIARFPRRMFNGSKSRRGRRNILLSSHPPGRCIPLSSHATCQRPMLAMMAALATAPVTIPIGVFQECIIFPVWTSAWRLRMLAMRVQKAMAASRLRIEDEPGTGFQLPTWKKHSLGNFPVRHSAHWLCIPPTRMKSGLE